MNWLDFHRICQSVPDRGGRVLAIHLLGLLQVLLWLGVLATVGMTLALAGGHSNAIAMRPLVAWTSPSPVSDTEPTTPPTDSVENASRTSEATLAAPPDRPTAPKGANRQAWSPLLIAAGMTMLVLAVLADHLRRSLIARDASQVAATARVQVHRQIYRQGLSALPTEGIGPAVDLFAQKVDDVRDGLLEYLGGWVRWPALTLGLLLGALLLNWQLTLFLLALAGLVALATSSIRRQARRSVEAAERDAMVQLNLLQEDLGLVRTVRVFGIEGIEKRRFEEHLEEYQQADRERLMTEGSPVSAFILMLGVAGALTLGLVAHALITRRVAQVDALMTLTCLALLWIPIQGWRRMRHRLKQAGQAASAIARFLDRKPELLQIAHAKFLPPVRDQIMFENVTVEGPSGRTLLEGVSIQIPAGTRTAIMGRDEDSKHALACLIPRLIDPKIGRVRIDGLDLREVTLDSLRAQVGTVFQSDLVFSDTVARNLGLGDPGYDLARLIEAAKLAHAHHFIMDLPQGYDTYVGPLGFFLRVDEQYRIALARAWLHEPSILILEEPPGGIDDDVKQLIDDSVNRLSIGRTVIFLPHRLSTIRSCQQVVILHNGRVEAIGNPRDLQAESKIFRHLQYAEFNQFAAGDLEAGVING